MKTSRVVCVKESERFPGLISSTRAYERRMVDITPKPSTLEEKGKTNQ